MNGAAMQAMQQLARCALGIVVLVVVASSTACGAAVHLGPADEPAYVAPLAIAGPHDELVYNNADDEDATRDGIQLTVRVDLLDGSGGSDGSDGIGADIDRVDLVILDSAWSDVVTEDLAGRRAAFFDVTLAGIDTHVTASAETVDAPPDATNARVEVKAILRSLE